MQCQLLSNKSTLLSSQSFENIYILSTVDIDSKKVLKLIQGLNANKAHGHDVIPIRMLNICKLSVINVVSWSFS